MKSAAVGPDGPAKPRKRVPRVLRVLGAVVAFAVTLALSLALLSTVFPQVRVGFGMIEDEILFSLAPGGARYPSEGPEDQAAMDNEATSVEANEAALTAVYGDGDGRNFTAPRASIIDMLRLRAHLGDAEMGWLNAHTGTVYVTYRIRSGGRTWVYYQHVVDTGYVFCRELPSE